MGCGPTDSVGAGQAALLTGPTTVAPITGFGDPTTTITVDSSGNVNWIGGAWYVPLPVSAGDVVGSVSAIVRDNGPAQGYIPGSVGDGGSYVKLSLLAETPAGTSTLATYTTPGDGVQRLVPIALSMPHTVVVGELLVLETEAGAIWPSSVMHPSMTGAVTVSAYVPPPRVLTLPLHGSAFAVSGSPDTMYSQQGVRASSMYGVASLPLLPGSTIVAIRVDVNDDPSPTRMVAVLSRLQKTGTVTPLAQTAASAGNGTTQELSASGLNIQTLPGSSYNIAVTDIVGSAPTSIFMGELDYVPPPSQ